METTYSVLGLQVDGMLEGIAGDRDARVREILAAGRAQAEEIVAAARTASRRRMSETLRDERSRMDRSIQQESAGLATAARVHRLQVQRDRLERGHSLVAEALRDRWRSPEARGAWLETARRACTVLEPGRWRVALAEGVSKDDMDRLRSDLSELAGEPPELSEDDQIDAGLRVFATDVCLDMSVDGLLRDRERVEGLLLATLLEVETATVEGG